MQQFLDRYWQLLPNFDWSNLLLRVPLAAVFLQQGMSKLPFNHDMAAGFGLSDPIWWFVIISEIAAGAGLLVGGVMSLDRLRDLPFVAEIGDMLTRFSGIVMCSIATGVIWITKPESLWAVVFYDNLHVFLWVGGLYFALRGNWAVAINRKLNQA